MRLKEFQILSSRCSMLGFDITQNFNLEQKGT